MTATYDLIVVGEGIAGLACAAECSKLGLKVATYEAEFFGGLVVNVNEIARFEAADGLSGMDYAGMLAMTNKKAGVKSTARQVNAIHVTHDGFEVETDTEKQSARFVVLATGARLKKLGVPGEAEYEGRGVSHCADCDAPMFSGAEVIVAGAGNWALQDALLLARECKAVHLVYAEAALFACPEYVAEIEAQSNIHLHPEHAIEEVLGDASGMTGVRVRDTHGNTREIAATGLFAIVGLEPRGALAPSGVQRDDQGHLSVDESLETAVPGLWAIGQVRAGFAGWLKDALEDAGRAANAIKARAA